VMGLCGLVGGGGGWGGVGVGGLWWGLVSHHFYTMDETEKEYILRNYPPEVWTYEGVAWYAFLP